MNAEPPGGIYREDGVGAGGVGRDLCRCKGVRPRVALGNLAAEERFVNWTPSGRIFGSAGAVIGAVLAVLLGAGDAQALNCYEDRVIGARDTERGFFVDPARKTALSLRPSPCSYTGDVECDYACVLQHEDGPAAKMEPFDYAGTHGVCRDSVTGLDHALVHLASGKYMAVQLWSVNPASGEVKREYQEAWYDLADGLGIEGRTLLVGADGRCLWRNRQQGYEVFQNLLSTLRVGKEADLPFLEGASVVLPVREVPAEVVTQQLLALDAVQPRLAEFEAAVYADEAGRAAWRVIQVTGTTLREARGVVLVEDRRTGVWRTMFDVGSDDEESLNSPSPAWFMVVTGNTLTMEMRGDAYSDGCFAIDLPTNRATSLGLYGSVCKEMRELHYPYWDEDDPAGEKPFNLRHELGMD